jgi:predicted HTH domain antitoxin
MTWSSLTIQIPNNLLNLGISPDEIQNRISEWLVFLLFSEGKISSGKAGKLLGISRQDFI